MALVAGGEVIGPATSWPMPKRCEQSGERQVFAERHQMHLVDGVDDLAAVVDHEDRIVIARRRRGRAASARTAPAISIWPSCSISPIAVSASGRSVNRNGHRGFRPEDQLRLWYAFCGSASRTARSSVAKMRSRTRRVPFLAEIDRPAARCGPSIARVGSDRRGTAGHSRSRAWPAKSMTARREAQPADGVARPAAPAAKRRRPRARSRRSCRSPIRSASSAAPASLHSRRHSRESR